MMLVWNKNDQKELRSVKLNEGNNMMFFDTLAMNVDDAFMEYINSIVECYTKNRKGN